MNVNKIEFYQNGVKVDTRGGASEEEFDNIVTIQDCFDMTNGLFRKHLLTTVFFIVPDGDGHPEVEKSKRITPEYNELQTDLIRQGYILAMERVKEKAMFPLDNDQEKIINLYRLYSELVDSIATGAPLQLNDIRI